MAVLGFLVAGHATFSFPIKVDDALSRKVAFCVEQRMTEPVFEHLKVRSGSEAVVGEPVQSTCRDIHNARQNVAPTRARAKAAPGR